MGEVFFRDEADLFGDPVPIARGRKGRPAHVPTAENRRFVQLSLVCGHAETDIAADLRISTATLRRHYFHELGGKRSARRRLEMKNLGLIVAGAEAGKTAAQALLAKQIDKLRKRELADQYQAPAPAPEQIGKKEAKRRAAQEVTGLYAPLPQPLLN